MKASESIFRILSIDGGGIRGVCPAHIISCISERLAVDVYDKFNLIAGTSTGAIVASAISCRIPPKTIIQLFKEYGPIIFNKKQLLSNLHIRSLYSNNNLKYVLKEIFQDIKLGDLDKPLILPASSVNLGGVHVFKSSYSSHFTRDKNTLVRDAVLASCSAPVFFNPVQCKEYLLADGGLWANNPVLVAIIDAKRRLSKDFTNLKVLSLGTGHSKIAYKNGKKTMGWGFLTGWKRKKIISYILSLQSESAHNMAQLLLNKEQLLRLNFESDNELSLDDVKDVDYFIAKADSIFTNHSEALKKFLL